MLVITCCYAELVTDKAACCQSIYQITIILYLPHDSVRRHSADAACLAGQRLGGGAPVTHSVGFVALYFTAVSCIGFDSYTSACIYDLRIAPHD